jgi:hypothetical protein
MKCAQKRKARSRQRVLLNQARDELRKAKVDGVATPSEINALRSKVVDLERRLRRRRHRSEPSSDEENYLDISDVSDDVSWEAKILRTMCP